MTDDNDVEQRRNATPEAVAAILSGAKAISQERAAKKTRLNVERSQAQLPVSSLTRLPVELLAEILILTRSPKDVLSVARTCKYLCATLLNPSSVFIWRTVRKICLPEPLPEPISTFTESSYAAFLFDEGVCEICNKSEKSMYKSFSLRLRLCNNTECFRTFLSRIMEHLERIDSEKDVRDCIPSLEAREFFNSTTFYFHFPVHAYPVGGIAAFCRFEDFERVSKEVAPLSADERKKVIESKMAYKAAYITLCRALHTWKSNRQKYFVDNKAKNENLAKTFAKDHGWKYEDVMNAPPFNQIYRRCIQLMELINDRDLRSIEDDVDQILVRVQEQRKRREHENAYTSNRHEISRHYRHHRKTAPVFLTLSEYRRLPIMVELQSTPTSAVKHDLREVLESSYVKKRLEQELTAWLDKAKTEFGAILGFPNWKTASTNTLHPAQRVDARFKCIACSRKKNSAVSFDFAGACGHECPTVPTGKRGKTVWAASNFEKDVEAVSVIAKLASLSNTDVRRAGAKDTIDWVGARIRCMSCSPAVIIMDPASLISHCHRHTNMELTLLTLPASGRLLKVPFHPGLAKQIARKGEQSKAQKMVNYVCRYCIASQEQASKGPKHKESKNAFTFNGLRSHLKAQHNIQFIGDEDFYCSHASGS